MKDSILLFVRSIDKVKLRMCRRRNSTAIFTDAWCPGVGEQKVPERDLLMGNCQPLHSESVVTLFAVHSGFIKYMDLIVDRKWKCLRTRKKLKLSEKI